MASDYYAFLSRMKNIYRWGLMRNTRNESLSEHSMEVALIAHALGVIARVRLQKEIDPNLCAAAALFHDTSEILTGDMPTPIKYYNPEIRDAYKKVERVAEDKLLSMLPEDLQSDYVPLYRPSPEVHALVKAADRICAYIKCVEETEMGNREFSAAKQSILDDILSSPLPEVKIFMEEYAGGYGKTLDETGL